jgi:hypothetical protein
LSRPSDSLWLRGNEPLGDGSFNRPVLKTGVVAKKSKDGVETWVAENENEVFEIKNVSHMGTYVHQMTQEQVSWLKEQKKRNLNH